MSKRVKQKPEPEKNELPLEHAPTRIVTFMDPGVEVEEVRGIENEAERAERERAQRHPK